ncbi:MAG: acetoacetyl-[acyl-carrier protein] synthase [Cellvibrionaceae bacterium]
MAGKDIMTRLPLIVGFGGYNAAGRSSFHQSYQRTILDSLSTVKQQETLVGLAVMMGLVKAKNGGYQNHQGGSLTQDQVAANYRQSILDNTLIRKISSSHFDVEQIPAHLSATFDNRQNAPLRFDLPKWNLPDNLPKDWHITDIDGRHVRVEINGEASALFSVPIASEVEVAAQLPEGFNPVELYPSRFHPRGLQLAILGASDALNSTGMDWQQVLSLVSPNEIGAYSSSVMTQLDNSGCGGLLQARLKGKRVSAKQLTLGLSSMPSDFINAYVLGNLGSTASIAGACASFLFNLKAGVDDIRTGRRRVVMVSSSEAPILPEIIEGYAAMGALATTKKLNDLDGGETDLRRASRPFGENCGFVIGESTQHVVLMDDQLALELGASVYGAVNDVFVNADGFKKSISAPGPGNYLSFAQAVASARSLLGEQSIRQRSFVQAHGSSTPQNRVTESQILDRVAAAFGISDWPIVAIKAFVGHSLAPASGDQLVNTLGVFAQGILPGIRTIDRVADDVLQNRLSISTSDRQMEQPLDVAFLNSKGFGGNNATACVLSPDIAQRMLKNRHGAAAITAYQHKNQVVQERAEGYHQRHLNGDCQVIYKFGEDMLDDIDIDLSEDKVAVPGYGKAIDLNVPSIYRDMLD